MRLAPTAVAVLLSLSCTATARVQELPPAEELPASVDEAQPGPDCLRVESGRFAFHSEPWINLHHFLFEWARNVPERPEGDRRRAVEVRESGELETLAAEARDAWTASLALYRDRVIGGRLQADRDLVRLRDRLAAHGCAPGAPEEIDPEIREALAGAMPVYRHHWWPRHRAANSAWIDAIRAQLETYEPRMAERLAAAYGGDWPEAPVRVDVTAYANWAGAYTTNRPDQVTVSSTAYQGLEAVEILFHEVSHAAFFEQRVLGHVSDAFRRAEASPPERLFHVLQFVTPAELLRSLLPPEEAAGYRSIAERVYSTGSQRDEYRVVLEHWKPFLEGRVERDRALDGIAVALAPPERVLRKEMTIEAPLEEVWAAWTTEDDPAWQWVLERMAESLEGRATARE